MNGWVILAAVGTPVLAVIGAAAAIVRYMVRSAWRISELWRGVRDEIAQLGTDIRALVASKERDHQIIQAEIGRVANRLERHEDWHRDRGGQGHA